MNRWLLPNLASRAAADCQTPSQMFPAALSCVRPLASAPPAPDGASLRWKGWGVSEPCLGRCRGASHTSAPLASRCSRASSALSPYRGALLKNLTMNISPCINSRSLIPMQLFSTCNAQCGAGLQTLTSQPGGGELGASKRDLGNRHYWQT